MNIQNISWLDVVILLPLLVGLVRGLMRGLVTELIAILAVVLGCVGARLWAAPFSAWLLAQFTWPNAVCDVVAYTLLFLAVAIFINMVGKLVTRLLRAIHLGFLNRLLGGVFGIAKYAIVVLTIVFLTDTLDRQFHFIRPEIKQSSVTYQPAIQTANACLSFFRSESWQLPANN